MLRLDKKSIEEFIRIYKQEFNEELSLPEAEKKASEILSLYLVLLTNSNE